MSYTIRKGTAEEAGVIREMIKQRIAWFDKQGISQWDEGYLQFYTQEVFAQEARRGTLYYAEKDEMICGAFVLLTEDDRWEGDKTPAYYVHNLVTRVNTPGLGEIILDWCRKKAEEDGKRYLRLDMLTGNHKLRRYYENQGFVYAGSFITNYYRGDRMQYAVDVGFDFLQNKARQAVNPRRLSEKAEAGGVGAALLTAGGNVYTGVCIDTACSLGMCAEAAAIAAMVTAGEARIEKIVAVNTNGQPIPPCGRCRELISQMHRDNDRTQVMVQKGLVVTLRQLMPYDWK